jgi:hypothetical protein
MWPCYSERWCAHMSFVIDAQMACANFAWHFENLQSADGYWRLQSLVVGRPSAVRLIARKMQEKTWRRNL